jgi:hypothetical protein
MLVADAPAVAGRLLRGEGDMVPGRAPRRREEIAAPWPFRAGIRSIPVAERRGRPPVGVAEQVLSAVEDLGIAARTRRRPGRR